MGVIPLILRQAQDRLSILSHKGRVGSIIIRQLFNQGKAGYHIRAWRRVNAGELAQ